MKVQVISQLHLNIMDTNITIIVQIFFDFPYSPGLH